MNRSTGLSIRLSVAVFGCALALPLAGAFFPTTGTATAPAEASVKLKITVGKETTYLTDAPVRPDGTVDYVKAYNAIQGKGVTAENNAFIPILKIVGPGGILEKNRAATLEALGIKNLPTDGSYFTGLSEYLKAQGVGGEAAKAISGQMSAAFAHWDAGKYPKLAEWVNANGKQLDAAADAVTRDRWYVPAVANDYMIDILVRDNKTVGELAGCLALRATIRAADGQVEGAWKDALTVHRLGRLESEGGRLPERLVGWGIGNQMIIPDRALLSSGKLSAAQARACLADLQKLPPLGNFVDSANCERLTNQFTIYLTSR